LLASETPYALMTCLIVSACKEQGTGKNSKTNKMLLIDPRKQFFSAETQATG